jgi:hypothetical protein
MYWYKVWLKMAPNMTWYKRVPCGYLEAQNKMVDNCLLAAPAPMTIGSVVPVPPFIMKVYDGFEKWPHAFGQD